MSYPQGIDGYSTEALKAEITRRDRAHQNGVCSYCGFPIPSHTCKYAGRLADYHIYVPPYNATRSVLQDWVQALPLREQGTLLTGIRGCDFTPKYPLDSPERQLVAALHFVVMNAFDPREVDSEPECFMQSSPPKFKWSAFEHYPQHWVAHILHCCEVVGYRHPDPDTALTWLNIYLAGVKSHHLKAETRDEMIARLGEDRIASGEIVS